MGAPTRAAHAETRPANPAASPTGSESSTQRSDRPTQPTRSLGHLATTRVPVPASDRFPDGWARLVDLDAGDVVFGHDGALREISAALAPQTAASAYRVVFADGQSVVCGADHPWQVSSARSRSNARIRKATQSSQRRLDDMAARTEQAREIRAVADDLPAGSHAAVNDLARFARVSPTRLHKVIGARRIEPVVEPISEPLTAPRRGVETRYDVAASWAHVVTIARDLGHRPGEPFHDPIPKAPEGAHLSLRALATAAIASPGVPFEAYESRYRRAVQDVERRTVDVLVPGPVTAGAALFPAPETLRVLADYIEAFKPGLNNQDYMPEESQVPARDLAHPNEPGRAGRANHHWGLRPTRATAGPTSAGAEGPRTSRAAAAFAAGQRLVTDWLGEDRRDPTPGVPVLLVDGRSVLRAAADERRAYLAGLIEADPSPRLGPSGALVPPVFADAVIELGRSLGLVVAHGPWARAQTPRRTRASAHPVPRATGWGSVVEVEFGAEDWLRVDRVEAVTLGETGEPIELVEISLRALGDTFLVEGFIPVRSMPGSPPDAPGPGEGR